MAGFDRRRRFFATVNRNFPRQPPGRQLDGERQTSCRSGTGRIDRHYRALAIPANRSPPRVRLASPGVRRQPLGFGPGLVVRGILGIARSQKHSPQLGATDLLLPEDVSSRATRRSEITGLSDRGRRRHSPAQRRRNIPPPHGRQPRSGLLFRNRDRRRPGRSLRTAYVAAEKRRKRVGRIRSSNQRRQFRHRIRHVLSRRIPDSGNRDSRSAQRRASGN